jgi:hypothetical protein
MLRCEVYRTWHNHGLMLDMALLRVGLAFPDLSREISISGICVRAEL